jgi:hypothetical protein
MMRLDVIVLTLLERNPVTDSISTIDLVVESTGSGAICGDNIHGIIESFWTNTWSLAQSEQTIIITGHIESICCIFGRDEPAFEDITEVISLVGRSGEGGSY